MMRSSRIGGVSAVAAFGSYSSFNFHRNLNAPNSPGFCIVCTDMRGSFLIDAVRCAKLALNQGVGGALYAPSAYFMKSPPEQYHDDVARDRVEEFIQTFGKKPGSKSSAEAIAAATKPEGDA